MALDIKDWSGKVKHAELPVDQLPAVAFTVFADVWPWATGYGDRRHPICHWCGRNFDFDFDSFHLLMPNLLSQLVCKYSKVRRPFQKLAYKHFM